VFLAYVPLELDDASMRVWKKKEISFGGGKRWMMEIHTISGMDLAELRDAAEDRGLFRRITMTVARILRIDGTR